MKKVDLDKIDWKNDGEILIDITYFDEDLGKDCKIRVISGHSGASEEEFEKVKEALDLFNPKPKEGVYHNFKEDQVFEFRNGILRRLDIIKLNE